MKGLVLIGTACLLMGSSWDGSIAFASSQWKYVLEWGGGIGDVEDIAIDSGGTVYVLDRPNGRVVVFTQEGQYLREQGGFDDPTGLAIDENDFVYVQERCRIYRYTHLFKAQASWESCLGQGDLQLNRGLDARYGAVWVATVSDMLRFTPSGMFVDRLNRLGGTDVHIVPDGSIWVSREWDESGLVRHYAEDGEILGEWNSLLPGEESSSPVDIAVDDDGMVYISDGRIKIFAASGVLKNVIEPALGLYFDAELFGNDTLYIGKLLPGGIVKYHRVPLAVESATWGSIKAIMRDYSPR
jgi:DNA-binding beta-propeller fold protein YncE